MTEATNQSTAHVYETKLCSSWEKSRPWLGNLFYEKYRFFDNQIIENLLNNDEYMNANSTIWKQDDNKQGTLSMWSEYYTI